MRAILNCKSPTTTRDKANPAPGGLGDWLAKPASTTIITPLIFRSLVSRTVDVSTSKSSASINKVLLPIIEVYACHAHVGLISVTVQTRITDKRYLEIRQRNASWC